MQLWFGFLITNNNSLTHTKSEQNIYTFWKRHNIQHYVLHSVSFGWVFLELYFCCCFGEIHKQNAPSTEITLSHSHWSMANMPRQYTSWIKMDTAESYNVWTWSTSVFGHFTRTNPYKQTHGTFLCFGEMKTKFLRKMQLLFLASVLIWFG